LVGVNPKCAPTVFDDVNRAGSSIAAALAQLSQLGL
jgi:hypothetical protein